MNRSGIFPRVTTLEAVVQRLERLILVQAEEVLFLRSQIDAMRYKPIETAGQLISTDMPDTPIAPGIKHMVDIVARVAAANLVTVQELIGDSRKRQLAWPRQDAMRALHEAGYTLVPIGRFLGWRDRATVRHGIKASAARVRNANTLRGEKP